MSNVTYSAYDATTGLFLGVRLDMPADHVAQNTPPGSRLMPGRFDHLSQRVDLSTGQVVDYQPPQPSDNHVWDDTAKRWKFSAEYAAKLSRRATAMRRIEELEQEQHRAVREAMLKMGTTGRLAEIDAAIVELRKHL